MSITPVIVDGLVSIEPTILENGSACCCSSCPQFGYPDGNGTAHCCRLNKTSDTTCEPYYQERIKKLETEIERLKTQPTTEQERIKVLEWFDKLLTKYEDADYDDYFPNEIIEPIRNDIEQGKHWPKDGEEK